MQAGEYWQQIRRLLHDAIEATDRGDTERCRYAIDSAQETHRRLMARLEIDARYAQSQH